jgi:hypothetical protein
VTRLLPAGLRRALIVLAALAGLLLATAGSCDTGAAPSAPPATVAPTAEDPDDSGDETAEDGADDGSEDPDDPDDPESEGPDYGGASGQGNTGESR